MVSLESLLASLHILAVLGVVVFGSSQAALCRAEWMNAAVVRRLQRLDGIFLWALGFLLLSGAARVIWGIKGWQWYVGQPLFHLKMSLVLILVGVALYPSVQIRRWARTLHDSGALPNAQALQRTRRAIMLHTHLVPLVTVVAVFWTRGW